MKQVTKPRVNNFPKNNATLSVNINNITENTITSSHTPNNSMQTTKLNAKLRLKNKTDTVIMKPMKIANTVCTYTLDVSIINRIWESYCNYNWICYQ